MESVIVYGLGLLFYIMIFGGLGTYVSFEKGRNAAEGAIFGILLGPFGVIAEACMPTLETQEPQPMAPSRLTATDDDPDEPAELRRNLERMSRERAPQSGIEEPTLWDELRGVVRGTGKK